MTPDQSRMARAALRWSTTRLASEAGLTPATINRFENGKDSYQSTASKIKAALESTGQVSFNENCVCFNPESE